MKKVIITVLIASALFACKKEEIQIPNPSNNPTTLGGWIYTTNSDNGVMTVGDSSLWEFKPNGKVEIDGNLAGEYLSPAKYLIDRTPNAKAIDTLRVIELTQSTLALGTDTDTLNFVRTF